MSRQSSGLFLLEIRAWRHRADLRPSRTRLSELTTRQSLCSSRRDRQGEREALRFCHLVFDRPIIPRFVWPWLQRELAHFALGVYAANRSISWINSLSRCGIA